MYTVILPCILSFSFVHALVCANCTSDSCYIIQKKKQKKKKQKNKKTRTSVWVKIPKLCHKTPLSIFFLGKGRESFISDFIKNQNLVRFLPCPPACKYFPKIRHCVDDARQNSHKIDHKITFLQISHLSSNRRVRNLTLYFQFTNPNKRAHPQHEFWTCHVSSLP